MQYLLFQALVTAACSLLLSLTFQTEEQEWVVCRFCWFCDTCRSCFLAETSLLLADSYILMWTEGEKKAHQVCNLGSSAWDQNYRFCSVQLNKSHFLECHFWKTSFCIGHWPGVSWDDLIIMHRELGGTQLTQGYPTLWKVSVYKLEGRSWLEAAAHQSAGGEQLHCASLAWHVIITNNVL